MTIFASFSTARSPFLSTCLLVIISTEVFKHILNSFGTYMPTADTDTEVNFDSIYQLYDNLKFICELGYIHLWLNKSVWSESRWV